MGESTPPPQIDSLQREVVSLRQRVAELQRRLALFDKTGKTADKDAGPGDSISEREALLVEAERIAHMGSWVWDIQTDAVVWSDELFRIFGYDPRRVNATTGRFFAAVHPEDRVRVQEIAQRSVQSGIAEQVDYRVLRGDGSVRHVSMDAAMLFDDAGVLRRVVGTVIDITDARDAARKLTEANAQFEEAQSLAHLGSWSIDVLQNRVQWSREMCRILGYDQSNAPSPSIEAFLERVHPEDRNLARTAHEQTLRTGIAVPMDLRIVAPSTGIRYLRTRTFVEKDERGSVVELRGTILDMTELALLQQQLVHAGKMQAIGRLAGGIAHDFNNLLTVVRTNLELVSAEDPRVVEDIVDAVESARTLTTRLLAFGRKSTLRSRVVDLNRLVHDTVQLVRRLLEEQVSLSTDLEPALPHVTLDSHLTEQALINLLINARDAMPTGGEVVVSTRTMHIGKEAFAELRVRDTGLGMDEFTRERAFEPFFTTKADGKGSGLGLAMVYGAVEQQGGRIRLETALGVGTTFVLSFPITLQPLSTPPAREPTAPVEPGPTTSRTILLVEDQAAVSNVVCRLLRRSGHSVLTADRPSVALDIARSFAGKFDLVICDLGLPEMAGTALVREMKLIIAVPNVLFISGYPAEAGADLAPEDVLLAKPFTPAELREAIARFF